MFMQWGNYPLKRYLTYNFSLAVQTVMLVAAILVRKKLWVLTVKNHWFNCKYIAHSDGCNFWCNFSARASNVLMTNIGWRNLIWVVICVYAYFIETPIQTILLLVLWEC